MTVEPPLSKRVSRGRRLQAIDPGPSPELGKADTRSGRTTGSTAGEAAPERLFRWSGKGRTAHAALSASERSCQRWCSERRCEHRRRVSLSRLPRRIRLQTPYRKRPIRDLSQGACLPFQARGKVPDRLLATSLCLPFQAWEERPDRPPAIDACLPFRSPEREPDRALHGLTCSLSATSRCSGNRREQVTSHATAPPRSAHPPRGCRARAGVTARPIRATAHREREAGPTSP